MFKRKAYKQAGSRVLSFIGRDELRVKRLGWSIMAGWTLVLILIIVWNWSELTASAQDQAATTLRITIEKDLLIRHWATEKGGIYAEVDDNTPPNPYLGYIEEQNLTTPSGRRLTLLNPAYMMRQIHEIGWEEHGVYSRLISLNPVNPGNLADSWESEALKIVEEEALPELSALVGMDGELTMRLLQPFYTEESCLACHAEHGHQVGDMRGAISAATSIDPFLANVYSKQVSTTAGYTLIWLLGFLGIGWATHLMTAATREAEVANKTKGEFLATMSHEIRTPMNVIVGMSDLLSSDELTEEHQEFAGMIKDSAESLRTIINDILDFSKMEVGRLELEQTSFDLISLVENTVSFLALRAHAKDLELLLDIKDNVPRIIKADPNRLKQILINLLDNAIKFTDKGEVALTVEKTGGAGFYTGRAASDRLCFSVRDTGPGIPEDKQDLLFQSFSQLDGSNTRNFEGTGLGLAICKKLVEMMGGSINVISRLDEGSTFSFTIPIIKPADKDIPKEREKILPSGDLKFLRALIIDDNISNCIIARRIFTRLGITAVTATSGSEGLEILKNADKEGLPFDLVLLDQQMPETNGFQVAEKIRKDKEIRSMLVMMLSSIDMQHSIARCRENGLDNYVVKPLRQSELLKKIHDLLHKSRQEPIPEDIAPCTTIPEPAKRNLEILLVEDKPMNRKLASVLLEKKGWKVTTANSGRHALEILDSRTFDLVLMDIQMPELDGIEATRLIRVRERATGEHTPIVAMTAHAMHGDEKKYLDAGMDGYVFKPINSKELYRIVDQVTSNKESKTSKVTSEGKTGSPITGQNNAKSVPTDSVAMLEKLQGDKNLLIELISLFLEDGKNDIKKLRQRLVTRDYENAAYIAHGLKGELGNLGAKRGFNIACELETALREYRIADAIILLEDLGRAIKELEIFFNRPDWRDLI